MSEAWFGVVSVTRSAIDLQSTGAPHGIIAL